MDYDDEMTAEEFDSAFAGGVEVELVGRPRVRVGSSAIVMPGAVPSYNATTFTGGAMTVRRRPTDTGPRLRAAGTTQPALTRG